MPSASVELSTPAAQAAGARSALYRALGQAFRAPTPALAEAIQSGQVAREVQQAAGGLPYRLEVGGLDGAGVSAEGLESAYLALFEVGGESGAPCFLYEGEYGGGRMKVLEEVLRFYHWFGLRLNQERRERPDHLATELEFLHALTFQEAAAVAAGQEVGPLRQAERDFVRLHLGDLVAGVASKLGDRPVPFYPALARTAAAFCQQELDYLS